MSVFLHGLGLANYRGIGSEMVRMAPFTSLNIFAGANNSGKSTVLNFISRHMPARRFSSQREPSQLLPLESHLGSKGRAVQMAVGQPVNEVFIRLRREIKQPQSFNAEDLQALLQAMARDGHIWTKRSLPYQENGSFELLDVQALDLQPVLGNANWQRLWSALTGQGQGGLVQHWVPETAKAITHAAYYEVPTTRLIPAVRQISPSKGLEMDYGGSGLIDKLAELQLPDFDRRDDRDRFEAINSFLGWVTGRSDARIEVPHTRAHVLVHMDGKVLPLSSLGTGIEEVVMIAAFCTISDGEIVCIEEPEIHLHPILQRKLISYLQSETNNQYFIATHSAAFIDTPGAAVFHVTNDGARSRMTEAVLRKEKHAICIDLGHRASDIVQANAVIWVEGPSDRTYLVHWLRAAAPEFREGIHYSIMFYGGRLLSHLSADDEEVGEFISLRDLNRHVGIMMDSDRSARRVQVNTTKTRVASEIARGGGVAWITAGREVENYIEHGVLQTSVAAIAGEAYAAPAAGGCFDHALHYQRTAPKKRRKLATPSLSLIEAEVDKVKVSKHVVANNGADLSVLDLNDRIGEMVAMIRNANR